MIVGQNGNADFIVSTAAEGEVYVRNEAAIRKIISNIHQGHYCTILGPPYCQKSQLLNDVKDRMQAANDEVCLLLDLKQLDTTADSEFIAHFAASVHHLLTAQQVSVPLSPAAVTDPRSLQAFLETCLQVLERDLVLLIDHLECIRTGPLKSLLLVLRAIFMERPAEPLCRLGVVVASSLQVADLSLGPTSPFNIARLIWLQDLGTREGMSLIDHLLQAADAKITVPAQTRLLEITQGDRHLLPRLCTHCIELVSQKPEQKITRREIETSLQWFMAVVAHQHLPLREVIRVLEGDSDSLLNVMRILERKKIPRRNLNIDLASEIDNLQLTGAVRIEETADGRLYCIRNEVYTRYLQEYFHPERVVRALSRDGKWDEAIRYLSYLVPRHLTYRSILLDTVIDAIYAARDSSVACAYLGDAIYKAFPSSKVRIYLVAPTGEKLVLIGRAGYEEASVETLPLTDQTHPEVQAYHDRHYQSFQDEAGEQGVLVPLRSQEAKPLGVVAIHGFEADPRSEDFLELQYFLKQAGRAIATVVDHEQKVRQMTKLYEISNQVTRTLDLERVLQMTVEAAIEAVPAAQKGSLFLWDEKKQKLVIAAYSGFRDDIVEVVQLDKGEGIAGWVYAHEEPTIVENFLTDRRAKHFAHRQVQEEKSDICVPLKAWGRVIGVLCVDNITEYAIFQRSDQDLLLAFGTQAAMAIYNAHLHTELYTLGLAINQGDLGETEIFQETAHSITRISDAKAANLLLLYDTDDPVLAVSQPPRLCVSEGLGDRFDEELEPRLDGLTRRVLEAEQPLAVSHPDEAPGINPYAFAQGIRAYLCLPLIVRKVKIGVLFVHYDKPHIFSPNEKQMLSLFANQAALAIENARQREVLQLNEAVVYTGIVFSTLAHRITQKAGAIRNTLWGLRRLVDAEDPKIADRLDRIEEYAHIMGQIPREAMLPFRAQSVLVNLNDRLQQTLPRWCKLEDELDGPILDFSGLSPADTTVCVDPKRLDFVLEILATNAVRALRRVPEKRIMVSSEVRKQRIVVNIVNSGEAIPARVRNRLFKEPIAKPERSNGIGIGLLIARSIMRGYDGDLELVNTMPQKTTFSFWLPRHYEGNSDTGS